MICKISSFDNIIDKLHITGNWKTFSDIIYLIYLLALQDATVVYDNNNEALQRWHKVYLRNSRIWYRRWQGTKNVNAKTERLLLVMKGQLQYGICQYGNGKRSFSAGKHFIRI